MNESVRDQIQSQLDIAEAALETVRQLLSGERDPEGAKEQPIFWTGVDADQAFAHVRSAKRSLETVAPITAKCAYCGADCRIPVWGQAVCASCVVEAAEAQRSRANSQ